MDVLKIEKRGRRVVVRLKKYPNQTFSLDASGFSNEADFKAKIKAMVTTFEAEQPVRLITAQSQFDIVKDLKVIE